MPKTYRISAGDKVKSFYGATNGKIGTVVKVYPGSVTVGFDPKDPDLLNFAVPASSGLVEFRLMPGEFEPINKTIYSTKETKPN